MPYYFYLDIPMWWEVFVPARTLIEVKLLTLTESTMYGASLGGSITRKM